MTLPRHYLAFADPAYSPDWIVGDRPEWLSRPADFSAFSIFCLTRLDELDARANSQSAVSSPVLEKLWNASREENRNFDRELPRFLDEIGMSREEYEVRKRRERERLETGEERAGPTKADPYARERHPAARAAQDMAKLRFVIFPRFFGGRQNLASPWLEEIAAQRHDCTAKEARSWYENNGVPTEWRDAAAS